MQSNLAVQARLRPRHKVHKMDLREAALLKQCPDTNRFERISRLYQLRNNRF